MTKKSTGVPLTVTKRPPRIAATIKANTEALFAYAALNPDLHDRLTPGALAEFIRKGGYGDTVSRASIYNMLSGKHATGADVLDLVARAFGLQAWHMLTPRLDPAHPPGLLAIDRTNQPVILATEIEKELRNDLQEGARLFAAPADRTHQSKGADGGTVDVRDHPARDAQSAPHTGRGRARDRKRSNRPTPTRQSIGGAG